jgi:hypothetical protein
VTAAWEDEPTSPGTPVAKRTQSQELHAVRTENETLRARVINAERAVGMANKRIDALVLRVQRLEGGAR